MIYEMRKVDKVSYLDIDWRTVMPMDLSNNNGDKCAVAYPTTCQLCYNDKGIFFRFKCEDDKIKCTMSGYNEPIYDEETVELFISSTGELEHYLELEWNGIGGAFCARVTNDLAGNTKLDFVEKNIIPTQTFAENKGWSIMGFIPRELFGGDMCGEWLFNAYRIKRADNNDMILYAYSPTIEDNFHIPSKFATLKFD